VTVRELIELLSRENPEAKVLLSVGGDGAVHLSWDIVVTGPSDDEGTVEITSERP
jgi:hypothetical protein